MILSLCLADSPDIDILRGIGILTVIWYHLGIKGYVYQYISSFHMILFFIVSGYCYKEQQFILNKTKYFKKKIRSLLMPYILWNIIYTFINVILIHRFDAENIKKYFENFIFSNLSFGAIWFLLALFICSLISSCLIDTVKNKCFLLCISIVLAYIGEKGASLNIINIFRWQQAFFCIPAFILGHYFRNVKKVNYLIGVILGINGMIISYINGMAILSRMKFGENSAMFYIGAIFSVIAWYNFSKILVDKKYTKGIYILSFFGRNSLVVLVTHQFILFALSISIKYIFKTEINLMFSIVIFALSVLVEYFICKMYEERKNRQGRYCRQL